MRVLPDLTQKPRRGQRMAATVLVRDGEYQQQSPSEVDHRPWNRLGMESVPTRPPMPTVRVSGGRRQHQAPRNVKRLYSPQDQRDVTTVFVIMDRETGQVLARVRGGALHCEQEAERMARSQGCELADLKVVFEGELAE